jgi:hypothetical protein
MNKLIVIIIMIGLSANASTWYVRPGVHTSWNGAFPAHPIPTAGVYGAQNGTNYANAWNGLESIVWGGSGVQAGDTVYVCGSHIYMLPDNNYPGYQASIAIGTSGCTIRMDYASDPGLIFGGSFDLRASYPWEGPDANGVYRCTNFWNNSYSLYWQVDGTNITRLNTNSASTWSGGLGSWARIGNSNYIKTTTGAAPTTNIAFNADGWQFTLPTTISNVAFESCRFIGGGLYIEIPTYAAGNVPLNAAANHITFRNCKITDCDATMIAGQVMIKPQPGNDYWTFDGCEIGFGPSGIYSGVGYQSGTNQTRGIIGMTVTNCYIHDLDISNYPAIDGHAIGVQDNSDCTFVGNRIERTGCAIALFSYGMVMTNNLIARNFVKDIHWFNSGGQTGGEGIWISGGSTNKSGGNKVINNIVQNTGLPGTGLWESWMGSGISVSSPDHIDIANNTLLNVDKGISVAVNSYPANARIENNIIANATNQLVKAGNQPGGSVTCDYNLFYTNVPMASPFDFTDAISHDTHSVFANPVFLVSNPTTQSGFMIQSSSPAIGAADQLNSLTTIDIIGTTRGSTWDIGAYEYSNPTLIPRISLGGKPILSVVGGQP